MRVDAKRNLQKVATAFVRDPLATRDDIAKSAGVSQGTATAMLTKLDEQGIINKSSDVIDVAKEDWEFVKISQALNKKWAKEIKKITREDVNTLTTAGRESFRRYTTLMGDITDSEGGLNIIIDD